MRRKDEPQKRSRSIAAQSSRSKNLSIKDGRFGEAEKTLAESLPLQHGIGKAEEIFQRVASALHAIAKIRREQHRNAEAAAIEAQANQRSLVK